MTMLGDWELAAANSAGMLEYAKTHTGSRYRQRDEIQAGLRAVEAAVRADQIEKDAEPLRIARQLVDMYRHLVMDTPEDQRMHDEITASADRAFAAIRAQLPEGSTDE